MRMPLILMTLCSFSALAAGADENAVLAAEKDACVAFQKSDVKGLDAVLTEDFTLTDSHGTVQPRSQLMDEARKGQPAYSLFENRDQKVRNYGDAAVVTGRTVLKGTDSGKPFEVEVQFTDTLVRRKGKWLLAAGHVSRIKS